MREKIKEEIIEDDIFDRLLDIVNNNLCDTYSRLVLSNEYKAYFARKSLTITSVMI